MPRNPDFESATRSLFTRAAFVNHLGIALGAIGEGSCETALFVEPRHLQQDGFVHAGVLATLADHTAGGAAFTLLEQGQGVLTVEFKINLLRAARGERLVCRAQVLKPGRSLSVAEAEVWSQGAPDAQAPQLAAKATVTLAIVAA